MIAHAEDFFLERQDDLSAIRARLEDHPIAALPGPRQTGETTLARVLMKNITEREIHHFDLESPADVARLALI